jgi:hypothetical protein
LTTLLFRLGAPSTCLQRAFHRQTNRPKPPALIHNEYRKAEETARSQMEAKLYSSNWVGSSGAVGDEREGAGAWVVY